MVTDLVSKRTSQVRKSRLWGWCAKGGKQCRLQGLGGIMQADSTLEEQLAAAVQTYETGELDQALAMAQRLCLSHPDVAMVHNVHGVIAAERGDRQTAIDSYRRAIELDPGNCDVHFNLGNVLRSNGDLNGALASYRAALQYRPNDTDALFNMAGVLRGLGDLGNATKMYQVLVELAPDDPEAHNNLGGVLHRQGRTEAAIRCFRRALQLRPQFVNAHDNLCEVLEKTDQLAELRQAVLAAEQQCPPKNKPIALRKARLLCRDHKYAEARKVLANIAKFHPSQPQLNSSCWYLMADISDRLGNRQAALEAVAQANNWAGKVASDRGLDPQGFISRLGDLKAGYRSVRRELKVEPTVAAGLPQLVFLIGFPRSGATRLGTILARHSSISSLAGKPLAPEMARLAQGWQNRQAPNHEELTGEQIQELRDVYMTGLLHHVPGHVKAGRVVIDNLPLNIVEAGLINRVFPHALFLLALRHPCDCVLSCFMQEFRLNSATSNFLDLTRAAHCYDQVMSLWSTYRKALPARVHTVKSEHMASDPEGTVGQVLAFLELDREKTLLDLVTATQDVAHQDAVAGRWRRYRADMIPVLPTLLRWAATFGYIDGAGKGSPPDDTAEPDQPLMPDGENPED